MIDFDPSKYLTLTPAVGEETVCTRWVCPNPAHIAGAFMRAESPIEGLSNAEGIAITGFEELLRRMESDIAAGQFKVSRVWIGEARRSGRTWHRDDLQFPVRFALHSIKPSDLERIQQWCEHVAEPEFDASPLITDIRPHDDPTNLMRESCELMKKGDYAKGLPLYEFRHQTPHGLKQWKEFLTMPHWDGGIRHGMKLLVHAEQGYGDTIQFARYLPWLNGIDVDFLCFPCLIPLLRSLNFKGGIVSELNVRKEYDYHVPLCSLPLALDPTMAELPRSPYLMSDREKYWNWKQRIGRDPSRHAYINSMAVGICWAGSQIHPQNASRTTTLESILKHVPRDARIFSLQKGDAREQLKLLPPEIVVEDFTDELLDWSDTAAFVDNLDLVITVDTAVAHLAGAIGRPTKLIVGPNAEWRWGEESDRTRWYSSMVLDRT